MSQKLDGVHVNQVHRPFGNCRHPMRLVHPPQLVQFARKLTYMGFSITRQTSRLIFKLSFIIIIITKQQLIINNSDSLLICVDWGRPLIENWREREGYRTQFQSTKVSFMYARITRFSSSAHLDNSYSKKNKNNIPFDINHIKPHWYNCLVQMHIMILKSSETKLVIHQSL